MTRRVLYWSVPASLIFALLSAYVFATVTLQVNAHRLCWIQLCASK
jgi:hypothetical protein